MKFNFENIGFIDSGEIELNDLTVICGRNNTGKTYISHSIYGLLKKCHSLRLEIANEEHIDSLFKDGECEIDIPDICLILDDISKEFSKKSLKDVFNSKEDIFKNTSVSLSIDDKCNHFFKEYEDELIVKLGEDTDTELRIVTRKNENTIIINLINPEVSKGFVTYALHRELVKLILRPVIPSTFVITSERTGASMFYKDLDSQAHSLLDQIIELKDKKKLNPFEFMDKMRSRYSLPIRSNIDSMRYAQDTVKDKSHFSENKENFEYLFKKSRDVIGGSFKTIGSGVYYLPTKKRNRDKVELPMHLSSSATKSLYLLDLYIRHIAKIGDVLVIDEPELNLHPDAQRQLAQLLIRTVNSGIKLIITTHSDHLLREINTLIMLSNPNIDNEDKLEIFQNYGLIQEDTLSPDRVNAYVNSSNTHKIHKMDVNELGIHMNLFNKEINDSSNLSKEVFYLVS